MVATPLISSRKFERYLHAMEVKLTVNVSIIISLFISEKLVEILMCRIVIAKVCFFVYFSRKSQLSGPKYFMTSRLSKHLADCNDFGMF